MVIMIQAIVRSEVFVIANRKKSAMVRVRVRVRVRVNP